MAESLQEIKDLLRRQVEARQAQAARSWKSRLADFVGRLRR
ncbi:MAG TPA: hypothetical protein PKE47_16555 [Verrucomicrobiota bacterium]|nr:hypothetical protein [Verrucomicrobiota bacterium]